MHVNGLQQQVLRGRRQRDRLGAGLPDADVRGQALHRDAGVLLRPVGAAGARAPIAALGSTDLIFAAGGGIMAHPDGPAAGVAGLREAWEAAMAGIPLAEHARTHPALAQALEAYASMSARPAGRAAARLLRRRLHRLDRAMEVADLRRPADGAVPRRADARAAGPLRRLSRHRHRRRRAVAEARPGWTRHLPPVFAALRGLGAPIVHYKVCSTFDSAPEVGSIGRAIDIAAPILGGAWHPLVVAAPAMRRYRPSATCSRRSTASATASTATRPWRATRSRRWTRPTSGCHLAEQTDRRIGLVDFVALKRGEADAAWQRERAAGAEIVALDVLDEETLREAGRLVWERGATGCSPSARRAWNTRWSPTGAPPGCSPQQPRVPRRAGRADRRASRARARR